jgi:DNA primase
MINYDKNDIKNIKIIDIIPNYIDDKKMKVGVEWVYKNCPFCSHKNHFQVNIQKNIYNSFNGCCKGGDIINFIMEVEKIDFQKAIKKLGDDFNITQPKKISMNYSRREREILKIISEYEDQRLQKEINRFFDFVKFMEYEEIFMKALSLVGSDNLIHYIYNLKGIGMY